MPNPSEDNLAEILARNPAVKLKPEYHLSAPRRVSVGKVATTPASPLSEQDKATKGPKAKPFDSQSRPNKYHAERTIVDGISFASKREAKRYGELKLLQRSGKIRDLICQWCYPLEVNGTSICHYIADFVYFDVEKNQLVTEDCKGVRTPVYKLKKKLMFAIFGIKILET